MNSKLTKLIPFPLQLFWLGLLPIIPWLILYYYEHFHTPLSDEFLALFTATYLLWIILHLIMMWRFCHEPFHSLANVVRSLHQGDYTQRSSGTNGNDAVSYLYEEINTLADILQNNRFAVVESMRQFQNLIDQLDIGVMAFDEHQNLTMLNAYASNRFRKQPTDLIGTNLEKLQMAPLWNSTSGRTLWLDFPNKSSRFLIHTSQFREDGRPQRLFLMTDVMDPLRQEERTAWKRLIRVMGHELNNSLTPIISLSNSLKTRINSLETNDQRKESSIEALDVISQRAKGLNRFIDDYSTLAKLPEPNRQSLDLREIINRTVSLMDSDQIEVKASNSYQILVDPDQTDQLIINLLQNAREAIDPAKGKVEISWQRESTDIVIHIDDNGPGIEKSENLFVPFYSTKPSGSGIGLVLCRQIVEAIGGSIILKNRPEGGCRVSIHLPLDIE